MTSADISVPFHSGEREIQQRLGVRERIEALGRRVIRDYLPDQHRDFYGQLPLLLTGTIDTAGRPWASVLFGRPGFITSPDPKTLVIAAQPLFGDPLKQNLAAGRDIGLLGIEFHSRRRNRMNARIAALTSSTIEIRVKQSFGNCPQYIQARDLQLLPALDRIGQALPVNRISRLSETGRAIIERADNFFIASYFSEAPDNASHGADVSHRGGKPGFVRIDDARSLTFPDFTGNFHFNTLGNILRNPLAGLLFIDFENGDLLSLTGEARIIWDSDEKRAFAGAERLVRFTLTDGVHTQRAVPIQWRFLDDSPSLEHTGSWDEVAAALAARHAGNTYCNYRVTRVEQESTTITSFYLERESGDAIPCHKPGQFLPLELHPPGADRPIRRPYTISNAPNGAFLRLSIKREAAPAAGLPDGAASSYFHDHVQPGSILRALPPRGTFTLNDDSLRSVVLISAGVGITPMISHLEQLVENARTCGYQRAVWFIHGARNGDEQAFGAHVRTLAGRCAGVRTHIRYSHPLPTDQKGRNHDSVGHVDISLLKTLLPFDDYDFFLCGPVPFMQALFDGLKALNVPDDRIHYEFFGASHSMHHPVQLGFEPETAGTDDPVPVTFERAGIHTRWDPKRGTLLDLAESEGLTPPYSCRSGICQTCSTRLIAGAVTYLQPPMVAAAEGEVLICCSYPHIDPQGGETSPAVVLDL